MVQFVERKNKKVAFTKAKSTTYLLYYKQTDMHQTVYVQAITQNLVLTN